jgi:DNA polymerase-3 subunit beta
LSNLLLSAEKGQFLVTATNLENGVVFRVGAKVETEGKVTVPAKVFSELVGSLPPEKVELNATSDELKVNSGKFKATIQGIAAGEFPEFPKKTKGEKGVVSTSLLTEIVDKVGFSSSSDDSRPVLTGVLWDLGKKSKIVATDGYRLSLLEPTKTNELGFKGEAYKFLIPGSVLREVARIFEEVGEDKIDLYWSDEQRQMFFSAGDVEVVARLLEGEFPNFEAIIPSQEDIEIMVNKTELFQAVKVASIFARESANIVRWDLSSDGLKVSANSPQVGENVTEVEVSFIKKGSGMIAFNSRYLIDFLSRVEGERIRFKMTDSLKPGVFEEEKGKEFLHIIMPVRVQGESND